MEDKHADKGPALGTHTVAVDQRHLMVGHGTQGAGGVGHRGSHSLNKAYSSYDIQDKVEILDLS